MSIWKILEIEPTSDRKAIKRAYAKVVKNHKPEQDPEGYQRVRDAFDKAISWAKNRGDDSYESAVPVAEVVPQQEIVSEPAPSEPDPIQPKPIEPVQVLHEPDHVPVSLQFELPEEEIEFSGPSPQDLVDDVLHEMDRQLHEESYVHAIDYLKAAMQSEDFINIDVRMLLEKELFLWAASWRERFVPCHLFKFLVETYDWHGSGYRPEYQQGLARIEQRIRTGEEFEKLCSMSSGRYVGASALECRAAKLLLGDLKPRYFYWLIFCGSFYSVIQKLLTRLRNTVPEIFEYELDRETVHWFLERQDKYYFSVSHLLMGAIPGFFLGFYIIDVLQAKDIYLASGVFWAIAGFFAALGGVSAWLLVKGLSVAATHAKAYLRIRYLKALPKLQALAEWTDRPLAFFALFCAVHGLMAGIIFTQGLLQYGFIALFLVVSLVMWLQFLWPVFLNGCIVLLTMVIGMSNNPPDMNLPGTPVHYGILMTYYVTYLSVFVLHKLPEKIDKFLDKHTSLVFLMNIAFSIAIYNMFLALNDLVL